MSAPNRKKIALRLRPPQLVAGFADPAALRQGAPLELLQPDGQRVLLDPLQWVMAYFIADFAVLPSLDRPAGRAHARLPGLHVRCRLAGYGAIEGILASELLALDDGLDLLPLRDDGPWQRAFIPRRALEALTPLEFVRPPRRRRPPGPADQFGLFPPPDASSREYA